MRLLRGAKTNSHAAIRHPPSAIRVIVSLRNRLLVGAVSDGCALARSVELPLGVDEHGRKVLTYLDGETIGEDRPWPPRARSDAALLADCRNR